jgi:hypothetical protein
VIPNTETDTERLETIEDSIVTNGFMNPWSIRKYRRSAFSLRSLLLGALGGSEIGSNRLQDQGGA